MFAGARLTVPGAPQRRGTGGGEGPATELLRARDGDPGAAFPTRSFRATSSAQAMPVGVDDQLAVFLRERPWGKAFQEV